MVKEEGAKTVVYGGSGLVTQQYCGTVGGQSTDYSTLDSDIRTAGLKNNSLARPDLWVNGYNPMYLDTDCFTALRTAFRE